MHQHPKASLIVLNHNPLKKLGPQAIDFLKNITSTQYPNLEIILVDNASTDNSIQIIEKTFNQDPRIKILKLQKNLGYAGGNNQGFRKSSKDAKYIAFLNNDLIVEPDWLEKIITAMEKDEKIAAAQPKILQLRDKNLVDSLGGSIDELGRAYDLGHGTSARISISQPYQIFYARGAAIVIKRDIFQALGGFDEDYFIYYEETDLCWRARLLGYKIITVPTSIVYHLGGGTMGQPNPQSIYLSRKNQLTTLIKNYEAKNMIKNVSELLLRYILYSLITLLRKRETKIPAAIISAILWNIKNLTKTWKKRIHIQQTRKIRDSDLKKHMLTKKKYEQLTSYLTRAY